MLQLAMALESVSKYVPGKCFTCPLKDNFENMVQGC